MTFIQDLERSGKYWLGAIILFFVLQNGGAIEGMINPVVSVAHLDVSKDDDGNGWAEISGQFEKLRGDCTYEAVEWYWVGQQSSSRVSLIFPMAETRGKGKHSFSDWQLQMPYEQVTDYSYALAYHDCHPLWKTRTKFYP